jgi:hypothetical protein
LRFVELVVGNNLIKKGGRDNSVQSLRRDNQGIHEIERKLKFTFGNELQDVSFLEGAPPRGCLRAFSSPTGIAGQ